MSIEQMTRDLSNKRKKCLEVQKKSSTYAKTAAEETAKANKAVRDASRSRQASTISRKLAEEQRHRKLSADALEKQASCQKSLSVLEADASRLEKKLNDARIAESKRMAKETERKIGAIKLLEINAPLVGGDNYGNVAVGNNVQQQLTISQEDHVPDQYRDLDETLCRLSETISGWQLGQDTLQEMFDELEELRRQIRAEKPDDSVIRRGITVIKGLLAPIVLGLSNGVTSGVASRASEFIQHLSLM